RWVFLLKRSCSISSNSADRWLSRVGVLVIDFSVLVDINLEKNDDLRKTALKYVRPSQRLADDASKCQVDAGRADFFGRGKTVLPMFLGETFHHKQAAVLQQ